MSQKTKHAQSIVRRDDNRAFRCEMHSVVASLGARPGDEAAPIEPNNYRQPLARAFRWRPNVEIEAILARPGIAENHIGIDLRLHAASSKLGRFSDLGPGLHRLRGPPTQVADGRRRKWNAAKNANRGL